MHRKDADMKEFVIIGLGDFSDIVYYTISKRMKRKVACFVLDDEYYNADKRADSIPVLPMSEFIERNSPESYTVALGFVGGNMFDDREKTYKKLSALGYTFENVTDTELDECCEIGEGNIILRNAVLGYNTRIGNGNIIWQGSVMPHHNIVGCFNNIAPTVSLSGFAAIGDHCYIGNNAIIKNRVIIADYTLVGAGAYVTKNTESNQVIVPCRSYVLDGKRSRDFY